MAQRINIGTALASRAPVKSIATNVDANDACSLSLNRSSSMKKALKQALQQEPKPASLKNAARSGIRNNTSE